MFVIDKDKAAYLRNNLKGVCICRTMKKRGSSKRNRYFVEESNAVLSLLSQYDNGQRIVEEYPASE